MKLEVIAYVRSPYLTKFGVPRQPGLVNAPAHLEFTSERQRDATLSILEPGDRCILIWRFSHNVVEPDAWSKTVRPPLLGGTERVGVFATRSSFRPNDLALSCVTVDSTSEGIMAFRGCDMVDGTPVLQILPYDETLHFQPSASEGWRSKKPWPCLERVIFPRELLSGIDAEARSALKELLSQDPRPAYARAKKHQRAYWIAYDRYLVRFACVEGDLVVTSMRELTVSERAHVSETGDLPSGSAQLR